jgi:hypothetical protein
MDGVVAEMLCRSEGRHSCCELGQIPDQVLLAGLERSRLNAHDTNPREQLNNPRKINRAARINVRSNTTPC